MKLLVSKHHPRKSSLLKVRICVPGLSRPSCARPGTVRLQSPPLYDMDLLVRVHLGSGISVLCSV